MTGLVRFVWRHKRGTGLLVLAAAAALAAFYYSISLDEGTRKQLKKQFSEAREMPRRLLT